MFDQATIEKNFEKIGTSVKFRVNNQLPANLPLTVDVRNEKFDVVYNNKIHFDLSVLDIKPDDRHLLLMLKVPVLNKVGQVIKEDKLKLLCGHDERHYFSCGVPEKERITCVIDAKKSLMPEAFKIAHQKKDKNKNILKRNNKAGTRQGEWFFLKDENFVPRDKNRIRKNEPISRGRGSKPHWCEELYSEGGETVYVNSSVAPNGISLEESKKLAKEAKKQGRFLTFQTRIRNARVYARGKITHIDHSPKYLYCWHRVLMNTEDKSRAGKVSVFLD